MTDRMHRRYRWIAIFLAGGALLQSGTCLPANYFSQLAATSLNSIAAAFVQAFVSAIFNTTA